MFKRTPKSSLVMPTRGRTHFLPERLANMRDKTPELRNGRAELIIVCDDDDEDTLRWEPEGVKDWRRVIMGTDPEPPWPIEKWNRGAEVAKHDWLVIVADDSWPQDNKWLRHALLLPNEGYIGIPDDSCSLKRNQMFCPCWIASREWLDKYQHGYLMAPWYKCWGPDVEAAHIAKKHGHYVVSWDSLVTQKHVAFGNAPEDHIYRRARTQHKRDQDTLAIRQAMGFPWEDENGQLFQLRRR